jgi:hypothetical protein
LSHALGLAIVSHAYHLYVCVTPETAHDPTTLASLVVPTSPDPAMTTVGCVPLPMRSHFGTALPAERYVVSVAYWLDVTVTRTRMAWPMSEVVAVYVVAFLPEMSAHRLPVFRCHWYATAMVLPVMFG